jgi:toluene monooxygenase electron transfer component
LKDSRELLMCQSIPRQDCALEIARFRAAPPSLPRPTPRRGTLRHVRRLTDTVVAVDVQLERPLDFEAGQFALIVFPGIVGARAYSMVNFEPAARRLSFVVKRKAGGGVSDWLFGGDAAGAPLELFAPLGHAFFDPGTPRMQTHLLAIAGGSGIAGIASILRRAEVSGHFHDWNGHVFFGVRSVRDAFFLEELQAVQARFPARLEITVALSDQEVPEALAAAYPGLCFARGLVHEVAQGRMEGRFAGVRAYLAGPPPMVEASLRLLLREARLPPGDICFDKFT